MLPPPLRSRSRSESSFAVFALNKPAVEYTTACRVCFKPGRPLFWRTLRLVSPARGALKITLDTHNGHGAGTEHGVITPITKWAFRR